MRFLEDKEKKKQGEELADWMERGGGGGGGEHRLLLSSRSPVLLILQWVKHLPDRREQRQRRNGPKRVTIADRLYFVGERDTLTIIMLLETLNVQHLPKCTRPFLQEKEGYRNTALRYSVASANSPRLLITIHTKYSLYSLLLSRCNTNTSNMFRLTQSLF
jgi:hypothetical protein